MISPAKVLEHDTNHDIEKHIIAIAGIILLVLLSLSSDKYKHIVLPEQDTQQVTPIISCSISAASPVSQTKVQEGTPSGGCTIASCQ